MKQATEPPGKNGATTIVFSADERICRRLAEHIVYSAGTQQDVKLINEKVMVSKHSKDSVGSYNIERPPTSVVGYQ